MYEIFHFLFTSYVYRSLLSHFCIIQSSEGTRSIKDKAAELEAMKAQLAHIKALMEDGAKLRDCIDSSSDAEQDIDAHDESTTDGINEDITNVTLENRGNDVNHTKLRCFESNISDMRVMSTIF